ncbi:hypothetical protein AK812_SmicGene26100 [Symbiodinium microadriaticum]|uniref:Uncharacterized protein n=1 Tax=Symbiodinium microadriaticum TaxID=2951 RepID=A0A1Q9DAJ2_SYMMI|nr:hypothetical protein AK812_SmicGene26100 [Symbiodinium microadriaticum]
MTTSDRPVREFLHNSGGDSSDSCSSNSLSSRSQAIDSSAQATWNGAAESKGELSEFTVDEVTDTTATGPLKLV